MEDQNLQMQDIISVVDNIRIDDIVIKPQYMHKFEHIKDQLDVRYASYSLEAIIYETLQLLKTVKAEIIGYEPLYVILNINFFCIIPSKMISIRPRSRIIYDINVVINVIKILLKPTILVERREESEMQSPIDIPNVETLQHTIDESIRKLEIAKNSLIDFDSIIGHAPAHDVKTTAETTATTIRNVGEMLGKTATYIGSSMRYLFGRPNVVPRVGEVYDDNITPIYIPKEKVTILKNKYIYYKKKYLALKKDLNLRR